MFLKTISEARAGSPSAIRKIHDPTQGPKEVHGG